MEETHFEKKSNIFPSDQQTFFFFFFLNSRLDIITKYTLNQGFFLLHLVYLFSWSNGIHQ